MPQSSTRRDWPVRFFEVGMRVSFAVAAFVLAVFAMAMTAYGIGQTVASILFWQDVGPAVLRGVGYIVVAIAVVEVAKYIVEEEVMRGRELRTAAEARRSLTKFVSTVSIAALLEGLVTVFRVSHGNVQELIYPAAILITAMLLILGLGAFQRLSARTEREIENKDRRAERRGR